MEPQRLAAAAEAGKMMIVGSSWAGNKAHWLVVGLSSE